MWRDAIAHPVKVYEYDNSKDPVTEEDAFADLKMIEMNKHVDHISLKTGERVQSSLTGSQMFRNLCQYLEKGGSCYRDAVIFPLSMPIPVATSTNHVGIGKVDFDSLVPDLFLRPETVYIPSENEGWTSSVVPPASFMPTHHNHMICGQMFVHFFGRKVCYYMMRDKDILTWDMYQIWLLAPANKENLKLGYDQTKSLTEWEINMALNCDELLVWVARAPSVVILPPHCFHTVFTLTLSCHSGICVRSDVWLEDMRWIIQHTTSKEEQAHIWKRKNTKDLEKWMNKVVPDFQLWRAWASQLTEETLTEQDCRVMEVVLELQDSISLNTRYFRYKWEITELTFQGDTGGTWKSMSGGRV